MVQHRTMYRLETLQIKTIVNSRYAATLYIDDEIIEMITVDNIKEAYPMVSEWIPNPILIRVTDSQRSIRQVYDITTDK